MKVKTQVKAGLVVVGGALNLLAGAGSTSGSDNTQSGALGTQVNF